MASPTTGSFVAAICTRHLVDELLHFLAVLSARRAFDTAAHVDRIGADLTNGIADVARVQAAGEKNRLAQGRRATPVERFAAAARLAGAVAIEQEGDRRRVAFSRDGRIAGILAHGHRLDERQAETATKRVVLATMELQESRPEDTDD